MIIITTQNTVVSPNFVERHSFRIVLGDSLGTMGNCGFPQNFHTLNKVKLRYFTQSIKQII